MNAKHFKIMAAAAALITAVSGAAFADVIIGSQLGKTETEVAESLKQQGATIKEIEMDDGMIEVEYSINVTEFEVEFDPATGAVASLANEDDDDDKEDSSVHESDDDDEKESG